VLYELLTGERPFKLLSAAMHEMARMIAEEEPVRPSTVVKDPVSRRLVGDLDSIVLMALRKEPERRYGSAESFGDDLQRHLEQRPIRAREATSWERFGRFLRKNPGVFLTAVLLLILILSGMGTLAWQVRHELQSGKLEAGAGPFVTPFWAFSCGVILALLAGAVYFAEVGCARLVGVAGGSIFFGLCMAERFSIETRLGWMRSAVAGNANPLTLFSPLHFLMVVIHGAVVLVLLAYIRRRRGRTGQAFFILISALFVPLCERVLLGGAISAMTYEMGLIPIAGATAMIGAVTVVAILIEHWIAALLFRKL